MNSKCVDVSKAPRTELDNVVDDDDDDVEAPSILVELPIVLCLVTTSVVVPPPPSDDDEVPKSLEAWSALLLRLSRLVDRPGSHDD